MVHREHPMKRNFTRHTIFMMSTYFEFQFISTNKTAGFGPGNHSKLWLKRRYIVRISVFCCEIHNYAVIGPYCTSIHYRSRLIAGDAATWEVSHGSAQGVSTWIETESVWRCNVQREGNSIVVLYLMNCDFRKNRLFWRISDILHFCMIHY